MRIACRIPKATNTHSEYVTHCFPTVKTVTRTRLGVTSYVNCLRPYKCTLTCRLFKLTKSSCIRHKRQIVTETFKGTLLAFGPPMFHWVFEIQQMKSLAYDKIVQLHWLSRVFCPSINKFINEHGGNASHTLEHYFAQRRSASSCNSSVSQKGIPTSAKKKSLPASHKDSDQLTS